MLLTKGAQAQSCAIALRSPGPLSLPPDLLNTVDPYNFTRSIVFLGVGRRRSPHC